MLDSTATMPTNEERAAKDAERRAELEEKFGYNQPVMVRADELLEIESPIELGARLSDVEKGIGTLLRKGDSKAVTMSVNQLAHTAKGLAEKNRELSLQLRDLRREVGLANGAAEQRAFIRKRF